MKLGSTLIVDTFAEAFRMRYARLIVTAIDDYWLQAAIHEATGCATSIIACDCEAGLEQFLPPEQTPDGRPGAALLFFGFSEAAVLKSLIKRVGQCVMTCPTTSVFDGLPNAEERGKLGDHLRFFGDGFQKSKVVDGHRFWRIPVMDGEFLVEATVGIEKGIGGGNIIFAASTQAIALKGARQAVEAIARLPGVITPFPGGVVRSGSKVGSRYKALPASTAHLFCPTLVGRTESQLQPGENSVYEIVIDGIDETSIVQAMVAACHSCAQAGVSTISAGNYGGKLGKFHFHLHPILSGTLPT